MMKLPDKLTWIRRSVTEPETQTNNQYSAMRMMNEQKSTLDTISTRRNVSAAKRLFIIMARYAYGKIIASYGILCTSFCSPQADDLGPLLLKRKMWYENLENGSYFRKCNGVQVYENATKCTRFYLANSLS